VEISEHMSKSQHKVGDRRLLMSLLTTKVDCVQCFGSIRRLHGELYDHRAYKVRVALFLSDVKIEVKVDDRECLV
jgi:hypothetical protein